MQQLLYKRTVNWLEKYSNLTYAILFNISLDHYYLWSVIKMEFHISVIFTYFSP